MKHSAMFLIHNYSVPSDSIEEELLDFIEILITKNSRYIYILKYDSLK